LGKKGSSGAAALILVSRAAPFAFIHARVGVDLADQAAVAPLWWEAQSRLDYFVAPFQGDLFRPTGLIHSLDEAFHDLHVRPSLREQALFAGVGI
jgi:hypothetical protein